MAEFSFRKKQAKVKGDSRRRSLFFSPMAEGPVDASPSSGEKRKEPLPEEKNVEAPKTPVVTTIQEVDGFKFKKRRKANKVAEPSAVVAKVEVAVRKDKGKAKEPEAPAVAENFVSMMPANCPKEQQIVLLCELISTSELGRLKARDAPSFVGESVKNVLQEFLIGAEELTMTLQKDSEEKARASKKQSPNPLNLELLTQKEHLTKCLESHLQEEQEWHAVRTNVLKRKEKNGNGFDATRDLTEEDRLFLDAAVAPATTVSLKKAYESLCLHTNKIKTTMNGIATYAGAMDGFFDRIFDTFRAREFVEAGGASDPRALIKGLV